MTTFKQPLEVYQPGLLPDSLSLRAYREVLSQSRFDTAFVNTVILAVSSTGLTLALSGLAGYAFARFQFPLRRVLLLLLLVPMLVPSISIIVPIFQLVANLGLLNTRLPIVIAVTASIVPMATFILSGFFLGLPVELEEAAVVDGAGLLQRLRRIVFPLATPAFIAAGVLAFREAWNEFSVVLALTTGPEIRTLPYELFLIKDTVNVQDIPMSNAFALMTVVPVLVVYLWLQRYVISGLTKGALN